MKQETKQINFDLSTLTLSELIEVYENIDSFQKYLEDKKIIIEEKVKE